jgi:hypothetical protein
MADKNESRQRQKAAAAAKRQYELNQIARLRRGEAPKHLEGATRLKAALFIRSRYEALLKPLGPYSMTEIKERLEAALGRKKDFKIHRWMLLKTETQVTPQLVEKYSARAEPQKKIAGYLELTAALAELAGSDPEDAVISFMNQTGLADRLAQRGGLEADDPLDPRLNLADLLRDFATQVSERLDLAGLFATAERLQAGWNPDEGPTAVFLEYGHERFTRRTASDGFWPVDPLPPFPSVCLARIPFGHVADAGFVLRAPGARNGTDAFAVPARGSATAFWRLHLSIVPTPGGVVLPCFLRTTGLKVCLHSGEAAFEQDRAFDISHHEDDLFELVPDYHDRAYIDLDGPKRISFDKTTTEKVEDPRAHAALYRRRKELAHTDDETPPHEILPFARLTPVGPEAIQHWLLDEPDIKGTTVEREPILAGFHGWDDPALASWMRGPCLARELEAALRTGLLLEAFSEWVTSYRQSLSELDADYLARLAKADAALRAGWRTSGEATVASGPTPPSCILNDSDKTED